MAFDEKELEEKLIEAGNKLADPPASVDELLSLLTRVEGFLARVEQAPKNSMQNALSPSLKALVGENLLRHSDPDVKVALASCFSEITRISAPEAPYDDDQMKEIFKLVVFSFENLHDKSSQLYAKRNSILETVAKVRSCVMMMDLECDVLILEMFQHFLKTIREYHLEMVFSSMETIMTLVLEESEEISFDLLSPLLDSIKKNNEEVLPIARKLGERVLKNCATRIKPCLVQAVRTFGISVDDYSEVLASICQDTSDSLEKNGACVAVEHREDKGKSAKLLLEDSTDVAEEEVKEAAHLPQDNRDRNRSSKLVANNGVACVGEDGAFVDSKSIKKKEDTKELNDLDDVKFNKNKQKPDQATKKTRRKSSYSTKSLKPSDFQIVANENEAEKMVDSEIMASASPSDSLPDKNHSEKLEKAKTKDSPANVEIFSKKTYEGASISKPKLVKQSVQKLPGQNSGVKKTAGTDSGKKQSRAAIGANAKKHSAKKLDDNEGGGSSSRQLVDKKKCGWGEANSGTGASKSSTLDVDKEIVSSPRSATKSSEDEKLEDSTKTRAKRKHASGTKNESEIKEYDQNVVGERVEVWWPKDREFYKGVIEAFDFAKKKHKVVYDDGGVEVLNLAREKWNIIEDSAVADESRDEAKRFRFKPIPNWDDIVDICAKDRACGSQVEHSFETDDVMDKEAKVAEESSDVFIDLEEPNSTTKKKNAQCSCAKGKDKDGIINFMREVAESLKDLVEVSRKRMGGHDQERVQEVLNEVEMIDDIDETQSYKAINWLIENPNKVAVLKALPLTKKKKYLLASMS